MIIRLMKVETVYKSLFPCNYKQIPKLEENKDAV